MGVLLMLAIALLGRELYLQDFPPDAPHRGDAAVALATVALALFTGLLWLAAAITARFARNELATSTAVNSADLTLRLDNRAQTDRALRIRHGAVAFLRDNKNALGLVFSCDDHDISPCSGAEDQELWCGLNSDLIDLFNYYDWIGYLTSSESDAIDREVALRRFGPWIWNYYSACKEEMDVVKTNFPGHWKDLDNLYEELNEREEFKHEEIAAFLLREHVRSHRGSFVQS